MTPHLDPALEAYLDEQSLQDTYVNNFGETLINRTPKLPKPPQGVIPFLYAEDVVEEQLEWLWKPYLPLSKLAMLDGDPGTGKSSLTCWLAAAISQGRPMLDQPGADPQNVLMLSAEDGLGDTVKPRLRIMGADMRRVAVSDAAITLNAGGLKKLETTIQFLKPRLVVIDPIVFYMGDQMDMNRANEVRGMTGRLSMIAAQNRCTIVLVRHLRKQGSQTAIYRGQGTIDFVGAARTVLMLERRGSGRTVLEHTKANLGRKGPTMTYTVDEEGRFIWGTAQPQSQNTGGISTQPRLTVAMNAANFLREQLANGPRAYVDLVTLARDKGIGERALERGKAGLVQSVKQGDRWYWRLLPEAVGRQLDLEDGRPS